MQNNIIPFDPIFSPIKMLFLNSPLQTEHAVGCFMREIEQTYRTGDLPHADFVLLNASVKQTLHEHRHSVQGLAGLEQWQRNAFAAQLGQALLRVVDNESLFECEAAAMLLKDQLGIGKTARALLHEPRKPSAQRRAGGEVIPFSQRIHDKKAELANKGALRG